MKMPFFLLLLTLLSTNSKIVAQRQSDSIYKEIRVLELQNNKIVFDQYFKEHSDRKAMIFTYAVNHTMLKAYIRGNVELTKLDDAHKSLIKQQNDIRTNTEEYKKLFAKYEAADFEKKKKISPSFVKHSNALAKENPHYKSLIEQSDSIRILLNHLALETMYKEYQSSSKIMSTTFISKEDLERYQKNELLQANLIKLKILHDRFLIAVEEEMAKRHPQKIDN